MKTRILLLTIGTLACGIGARSKRAVGKDPDYYNPFRIVAIDSGWDDKAVATLAENERVDLAGLPIQDLRENPEQWGTAFGQIQLDQLDIGVQTLDAGPLIPATMFAALIAKWPELQEKVGVALQELMAMGDGGDIEVWVMGSVSSTTGRAGLLELQFAVHDLLRVQGVANPTLNVVVMDSEGLHPERLDERRLIEAGYWREIERVVESGPGKSIPRPHAQDWAGGRPALLTFRRNGKRQGANLSSVKELADSTVDWLLLTALTPVVHRSLSTRGDRARALPRVGILDGHRFDPKHRYLSVANAAALDLSVPSLKAYAQARGAELVLASILGEAPTQVGFLAMELQLTLPALSQRLGEGVLGSGVNREINRLDQSLAKDKLSQWRRLTLAAQINLDTQLDHARRSIPSQRDLVLEEIKTRVAQRLGHLLAPNSDGPSEGAGRQATGVQGAISYAADVIDQLGKVRKEAEKEITTVYPLASCHGRCTEILGNISRFQRRAQQETVLTEMRRGYADAVRAVLVDHALRLIDTLQSFVTAHLALLREIVNRVTEAQTIVASAKLNAMTPSGGLLSRSLVNEEADFARLIDSTGMLKPSVVESTKTTVLQSAAGSGQALQELAACSADRLAHLAQGLFATTAQVDHQLQSQFKAVFEKQFDSVAAQAEVFRWLIESAAPLGGSIVPGYDQKIPAHSRPALITLRKVLLPPDMLDTARQHLIPLGIPQDSIQAVDGLPMMVCICEKHGLPAYAFSYLAQIGAQLPPEPQHRGRFVTANWALDWLPELTHFQPFAGWKDEELVHAGLLTSVVARNGDNGFIFKDKSGLHIPLGSAVPDCARAVGAGHRDDLILALLEILGGVDSGWLTNRLRESVEGKVLHPQIGRAQYQRLLPLQKWAQHRRERLLA